MANSAGRAADPADGVGAADIGCDYRLHSAAVIDDCHGVFGGGGTLCHPGIPRKVMENLPHIFLVARGAERFAQEMGFVQHPLLTQDSKDTWHHRLEQDVPLENLDEIR